MHKYNLELLPNNDTSILKNAYWYGLPSALFIDSTEIRGEHCPSYLGQLNEPILNHYWKRLQAEISQAFYLGTHSFDEITISFDYKSKEVDKAFVILSTAKFNGEIMTDTFSLSKESRWIHFRYSTQIKNCIYASLTFAVKGKGADITVKENQRFYIDQLTVFIDGIDIRQILFPTSCNHNLLDSNQLFSFEYGDWRKLGNYLINEYPKRILGLGESVHGSNELNELETGLLAELAINHNYKHILMEISGYLGFRWNLFITNPINVYPYTEFKEEIASALIDPRLFYQFLCRLKQHNMKMNEKDKIRIYGIDVPSHDNKFVDLLDSLSKSMNQEEIGLLRSTLHPRYPDLNEYAKIVRERGHQGGHKYYDSLKVTLPKIKYACENSAALKKLLGERNYYSLLESMVPLPETYTWFEWAQKREVYLEQRINNYLNKYPEEMFLIFGHLGHLNYIHKMLLPCSRSLGTQLYALYPNDFSTIGFIIGKGKITTYKDGRQQKTEVTLQSPPPNSLERLCIQSGNKNFFAKTSSLSTEYPYLLRNIGFPYIFEVEFGSYHLPDKMMDAFIFISNDSIQ